MNGRGRDEVVLFGIIEAGGLLFGSGFWSLRLGVQDKVVATTLAGLEYLCHLTNKT